MSKTLTIPVFTGMPNSAGETLQIALTPEGAFGRVFTPGVRGRGNRLAMMHEVPEVLQMRSGETELNEDMLKAVTARGWLTEDETAIRNALYAAWDTVPITVDGVTTSTMWLATTTPPTWTPVVVVAPPVAAPTPTAPPAAPVNDSAAVIALDATRVLDDIEDAALEALRIFDNAEAYTVPQSKTKWVPVKFNDTDIDAFDYLDKAREDEDKWNIAITGPTGCGKSALTWEYAASRGLAHAAIPFSETTDTSALFDDVALIGGRSVRVLTQAGMVIKYGGVLECPEINGAPDGSLTNLYEMLDFARSVTLSNGTKLHLNDNTLVVVTQNPADGAHTHATQMSVALDRRFWHVEMGYVDDIEAKLVPVDALREIAQEIRRSDVKQPFGTDSLLKVHKAIKTFGLKQGITGLITLFREHSARETVRPIVDVRLAELATAYNEEIASDVEEAELSFD